MRLPPSRKVLIDGCEYYACLHQALRSAGPGDSVFLCGVEGDADELLSGPGTEVAGLLAELSRARGFTTVIVTHNQGFAQTCDRVLQLEKGAFA